MKFALICQHVLYICDSQNLLSNIQLFRLDWRSNMRAYFKNDLYEFAAHDPVALKRKQKEKQQQELKAKELAERRQKQRATKKKNNQDSEKPQNVLSTQKQKEPEKPPLKPKKKRIPQIDDNLTLKIGAEEKDSSDRELYEMMGLFRKETKKATQPKEEDSSSGKKSIEQNQKQHQQKPTAEKPEVTQKDREEQASVKKAEKEENSNSSVKKDKFSKLKGYFSTNYRMKMNIEVPQTPAQDPKDQAQKQAELIKKKRQIKKIEFSLKKYSKQLDKKSKKVQEEKNVQEDEDDSNEKQSQSEQKDEQNVSQKKPKTKRIKKEKNYVRLDLKRKYQDRFLGALNANLRRYTRNGRLKPKYRKLHTQVIMQDGQLYNAYVSSLSAALCTSVNMDDSDNEDYQRSQQIVAPELPKSYGYEDLKAYLKAAFGFEDFRDGQYQTISHVLNGQSVVFVSETASGKSMTYLMSSMILGGLTMVVSPLVSLILDQLAHLPPYLPAACISSLINREQRDRIIALVKNGDIKLLFVTPESLHSDFLYHMQDFPVMDFVCVDEAHSLSELSHNFRTSFLGLGQILQRHVRYRHGRPTILALTATANPETVLSIRQRLGIGQEIRSSSCMNKNLFVTVSRERYSSKYDSLITYLRQPQIQSCRGILVYARTIKIMYEVYNYVTNSTPLKAAVYYSGLDNKQKTQTLNKFRCEDIKIVIATISLGMGLDFSHLECVVHINMPKSIENYVQEIGRAGRRERRAYCHLFLDQSDYLTERNYIIADELEPDTLLALYEKLRENSKKQGKAPAINIREQADSTVKRAALIIENIAGKDIIEEEQVQEDEQQEEGTVKIASQDCLKSQLFSFRIQKLTAATKLREQSLLTLLLKIEALMKNWEVRLKVLPTSKELLKIAFFKNNENQVKEASQFYNHLILGARKANGTYYINLIDKCNKMGKRPIQLLTQLYRLSNQYTMRVEQDHPVYVWMFEGKRKFTQEDPIEQLIMNVFQRLSSPSQVDMVLDAINKVQNTSLIKLNTLYTVGYLNSRNHMNNIVNKNSLIPRSEPIPKNSIVTEFDEYFRSNLKEFYNKLTNNEEQLCIPTTCVEFKEIDEVYETVKMFFRNEMNLDDIYNEFQREEMRRKTYYMYEDGKTLTKILMGISSGDVSYQIYKDRSYWNLFRAKNYGQLLQTVRAQFLRYKQAYQIRPNI